MAVFESRKAISEIISAVLIVLISISLVGTAYMWGMPMITKRQDASTTDRAYSYFDRENSNSLVRKVESVAKNGGQETFVSDVDGLWSVHEYSLLAEENNSLEFETFSKVSNIAISTATNGIGWVALTPGGSCPPLKGIVGFDPSYVVCAKAEQQGDGFAIKYRIWFRELYDAAGTKGYKVNVTKHESGQLAGTGRTVRIYNSGVYSMCSPSPQQCSKTLIITEVKILLV
jgi:FlaG/FlaF family flagellin (archaellin)